MKLKILIIQRKNWVLQYIVVTDISTILFNDLYYLKEKEVRELYYLTCTLNSYDVVQYVSILEKIQNNKYYRQQIFEDVADDLVNDLNELLED